MGFIFSANVWASPDSFENDNTCDHANFINISDQKPQTHNFYNIGDEDWLMFYGAAGKTYTIDIKNVGNKADPKIDLYDSDCTLWLPQMNGDKGFEGENESLDWEECSRDGIYFIKISCVECEYGENTGYDINIILPNAPAIYGNIIGRIIDSFGNPVIGAEIKTNASEQRFYSMYPDGSFVMDIHDTGTFTLTVKHGDSEVLVNEVNVQSLKTTNVGNIEIQIEPVTCNAKGDVNQDGIVLLDDVKLAFDYMFNKPAPEKLCLANVYDNGKNDMFKIYPEDLKGIFDIFTGAK